MDLINFENKSVRKIWHNEEWYFSIVDIIEVLTDSPSPKTYWAKLKTKEYKSSSQTFPFVERLKMKASDGRMRLTDCANTEGLFRIIMSVPSPKAEPLKLWLAEQGKRTIDELNDPELLSERQAEYYRLKGYSDNWIEERLKTIKIRKELTDEWKNREIQDSKEYSILTATIAKGTFGMTPSEHAQFKGLEKENLRDHMTTIELIFSSLSEEITRQKAVELDAKGFHENHEAAVKGGEITGGLVKQAEAQGIKVVSNENFKHLKGGEGDKQIDEPQ